MANAEHNNSGQPWQQALYKILRDAGVDHACYVPDAGHSELINLYENDSTTTANVLTTEEEGIAIATGAWLGGRRSVLLMQSSGVGNCINMLSLPVLSQTPLLMLVTMRGEWGEFNPWQVPMGKATQPALEAIGLTVLRADDTDSLLATVSQATLMTYSANQQIAVLMGQRLLGEKKW